MSIPGASNSQGGVAIDLSALNKIDVSTDRATASVGPGARWGNVYETLEPMNLAVVGGRVSDVGVGGLILGGGMSYFSNRYGLAADNVINFEVLQILPISITLKTDVLGGDLDWQNPECE